VRQFFGKYRGKVADNVDPLHLGRLQVSVPSVLGEGVVWALPCAPYGGSQVGLFAVPPVEANVWVEFEAGDPDSPIWSGCFWGEGEVPETAGLPDIQVLKTTSVTLTLSDIEGVGGVTLEVGPPAVDVPLKLVLNAEGIQLTCTPASVTITAESIQLSLGEASVALSPAGVSINDGALEVM
jgi:hypothetical protein